MEKILNIFNHIGLFDLIDILIMSIIIYQFFTIIRGTKAVQMSLGIVALFILFGVSLEYQLYALNWLLSHFFDSFFIILVILFQDDLRSVLINVGKVSPFSNKNLTGLESNIEEVSEAVRILSKEKTGALVVFERKTGLLNYIQSGTKMLSEIHSDILYTLFQSSSPLHDGAIILSDNRIQAAGCFLPLTKNLEKDRQFGTRHRAAIGISESTDAFVLVVSEETGRVGYCLAGQYYEIKELSSLSRLMLESLRK